MISTEHDAFYKMSTPDELIIENFPEQKPIHNQTGRFNYEGKILGINSTP